VQFLVVGTDGPGFVEGPSDLHEAHQQYMDGWSASLVARGPTLAPDGAAHTGSVHVVDVPDAAVARRFALEEPYARAGWYSQVVVTPFQPCVTGTMWDRPRPATDQPAAFVHARCDLGTGDVATLCQELARIEEPPWLFAGLALADDDTRALGLVGAVDLTPDDARRRVDALLRAAAVTGVVDVECHRWTRGGRRDE
jgi:uncharacterized protein